MDDLNKFSNLQATMKNMSALQNLAIGTAAMQSPLNNSPELVKNMQVAQKFMSSPAYQAMVKQQEILSKISIPEPLMAEFQMANNLIQSALQNETFARLNEIAQSRNFLSSALAVQDAVIDFLSEMKKIDGYQQKTLGEILKEIRLKKNGEVELAEIELPEDFPPELQESFKILFERIKNFVLDNKDFIEFVAEVILHINTTSEYGIIVYLNALLLGISAMKIKRVENFGE